MDIFEAIKVERGRQDKQHGGPEHDDDHNNADWSEYINYQLDRMAGDRQRGIDSARFRFLKIAALSVAAIESIDRRARHAELGNEAHERSTS